MNRPTVDEILQGLRSTLSPDDPERPNRYTAVIVSAKRARQINTYYRSLGEGGGFEELAAPLLPGDSRNLLSIAMEEVAKGEISYRLRS